MMAEGSWTLEWQDRRRLTGDGHMAKQITVCPVSDLPPGGGVTGAGPYAVENSRRKYFAVTTAPPPPPPGAPSTSERRPGGGIDRGRGELTLPRGTNHGPVFVNDPR